MWWKEYGFEILFGLAVIILVVLIVYNLITGKKGTFQDHTTMIKNLLSKPRGGKKRVTFESKGETECRRAIEKLTNKPFPKARPNFLKNHITGGHKLELDCYNADLKMAVEYNGEQHYKYIPYFHTSKDAYHNIKYRDEMKKRLCAENNITLIIVPYTVKHDNIEAFIAGQL